MVYYRRASPSAAPARKRFLPFPLKIVIMEFPLRYGMISSPDIAILSRVITRAVSYYLSRIRRAFELPLHSFFLLTSCLLCRATLLVFRYALYAGYEVCILIPKIPVIGWSLHLTDFLELASMSAKF